MEETKTNIAPALGRPPVTVHALRAEHELLLLCSRVFIDSADSTRIQLLLQTSLDWNFLLLAASRNHVLGLVSHNLKSVCAEAIPAPTLQFLRDCSRKTADRNHYLAAELKRVHALFLAHGVSALPFGGPLLAALAYRDASLRETNNIEFLVAPENILQARDLLMAGGYRREYTWDAAREAAELRFRRVLALDRSEDGVHIWLFCDLDPGSYSRPLRFASFAPSTVTLDGESITALNAEDAVLQACVRAASEALSPHLSLISDVAHLGANLDTDAWQRILDRAGLLGVKRKVLVILALASILLRAKCPKMIESSLRSDPPASGLCEHVTQCLFSDTDYVPEMRKRVALQLAARDRLIDKARFLIRFAAGPTRDDWAMMPLPSSFYYALRPFRMLGRRAGLFRQQRLAVFMPTPVEIVEEMLGLAEVGPSDTVYDLGCGDGRIVIYAAQRYGSRGVGVDLDPDRVAEAKAGAAAAGVDHLVTFSQQNVMDVDLSSASVVSLFLSPQANLMLRPRLHQQLTPQARIVSRSHDMGDWAPLKTKLVACDGALSRIYLWRLDGNGKPTGGGAG
jgi:SAM-dependent methyltransferase